MILIAGEALIDLAEGDDGRFTAHPGGGPCNTAVALGRLGVPVGFLGGLSTDRFGQRMRSHLADAGVDLALAVDTHAPTTLAVAAIDEAGVASYGFYLDATSAGAVTTERAPDPLPGDVTALWCGTLGLVIEPTATTLVGLIRANMAAMVVAIDPNLRPSAIDDMASHRRRMIGVMADADIVKLSAEDADLLRPGEDPADTATWVHSLGAPLVMLTRGGDGVTAVTRGGAVDLAIPPVTVVDTIGAGDSYGAGMLAALHDAGLLTKPAVAALTADDARQVHDFAAAVAAITVSRAGADPPWRSELPG
ncbi:MAG: carbohydrate kinase [Acidimicrobiia bacterium]|nr:carbohydrate kinase [Acidimicrobiia bacterium]